MKRLLIKRKLNTPVELENFIDLIVHWAKKWGFQIEVEDIEAESEKEENDEN